MLFQTYGDRRHPAVLFFHAMGVTEASSEPIARYLQDRYFCMFQNSRFPLPKASIQSVNTLRKTGDRFLQKNKSMKPFSGLME